VEGVVPVAFVRQVAKLERNPAKRQADEHEENRKVDGRQNDGERERKRREQCDAAQYQPGFVSIPDRRDRIHHQIAADIVGSVGKKDADAEIEAVEQHIHEHAQGEDTGP
jgi:hypothetical protein